MCQEIYSANKTMFVHLREHSEPLRPFWALHKILYPAEAQVIPDLYEKSVSCSPRVFICLEYLLYLAADIPFLTH